MKWLKTKRLDPATRNQILKRIEGLREKLAPLQTTWPPDQATALEELNKVVEQLKP